MLRVCTCWLCNVWLLHVLHKYWTSHIQISYCVQWRMICRKLCVICFQISTLLMKVCAVCLYIPFCGFCPTLSISALCEIVFICFSFPDGVQSYCVTGNVILNRMLEWFERDNTKIIYVPWWLNDFWYLVCCFCLLFKVLHENNLLLADDCNCTVHVVRSLNF